jgi:hypothetical protein
MTLKPLEKDRPFRRRARLSRREIIIALALTVIAVTLLSTALSRTTGSPTADGASPRGARAAEIKR